MKAAGVAGLMAIAALAIPVGIVVACSAAPDFVPFACTVPIESDDAGDGGDAGDGSDAGAGGDAGDAGDADAGALPTAYFYARQISAEDCTRAAISWIQCDDGIYARYYAVDSGALTIDYYQPATGDHVAQLFYPSVASAGECTSGPTAFTPPGCGGTQVVCCPYSTDAGDGGDTDADAAPDSGCGF